MARIYNNIEPSMWNRIGYQTNITNCYNCSHSNSDRWEGEVGECNRFMIKPFKVIKQGVCRHHSSFRKKNK